MTEVPKPRRLGAQLARVVFIEPTSDKAAEPSHARARSRFLAFLALVVVAVIVWWLFVPPSVDRPSGAIYCPNAPDGSVSDERRFDARTILGRNFHEGYDLAKRHGCVVQDDDGDTDAMFRPNRITVKIARGTITRIYGIG